MSSSGSPPDLELELAVALGPVLRHAGGHLGRRLLGDRAIEVDRLAEAPAQQRATGRPAALPRMSQQAMSMADFT